MTGSKDYLAKAFCLSMLLKAKCREVYAGAENPCLREDTNTTNTIKLHLHIRITVRVTKVSKVRAPRCILGISLHDNCIFVERVGKSESGF